MKRIAVLALLVLSLLASPVRAQKFYALVAADESPSAGWGRFAPHIAWDTIYIASLLFDNVPPSLLVYRPVSMEKDEDARPASILTALAELQPEENDTLLVYYSGHGASDDGGHYFSLNGQKLYRQDLRTAMEQKKARLAVLLTDCCNVRSDGHLIAAAMPGPDDQQTYTPVFQSLFINPRGFVDVNAAAPGESAFFLPETGGRQKWGSLFTYAFNDYLRSQKDRSPSWDEMLLGVSLHVHLLFREGYPRGAAAAKGGVRQVDQSVYASEYPGMPENRGPRTGLVVRDTGGKGALIVQVTEGQPGTRVWDVSGSRYRALEPGQTVVVANGKQVLGASDFVAAAKDSSQVMRFSLRTGGGQSEYLMRLRY